MMALRRARVDVDAVSSPIVGTRCQCPSGYGRQCRAYAYRRYSVGDSPTILWLCDLHYVVLIKRDVPLYLVESLPRVLAAGVSVV